MLKEKVREFDIPGLVRRLILSWLLAAVTEYCILPCKLRDLASLEGLAYMSLGRMMGFTCGFAVLLTVASYYLSTKIPERWGIAAAFAILGAAALYSSATWAFFGVCALVLIILAVFAVC